MKEKYFGCHEKGILLSRAFKYQKRLLLRTAPARSNPSASKRNGSSDSNFPSSSLTAVPIAIRIASSAAEFRAAAFLRATSFYHYPEGRSEWAAMSHRRMKADVEWNSLTAKVEGREVGYEGIRVIPMIAVVDDVPEIPEAQQVAAEVEPSTKLPADVRAGFMHPQVVVGTLDLNIGRSLPTEELQGKLPASGALHGQGCGRAYLSNVCVAQSMRRQGVAKQLIQEAERFAREQLVSHLYVHVVHNNSPAVRLYKEGLGFEVESEESENAARGACRPRRQILCKPIMV